MTDLSLRTAEQVRLSCARKIGSVDISPALAAILAFLLGDLRIRMQIGDMRLTPTGAFLVRSPAVTGFTAFPSAEPVLIRGILETAHAAGLDGDELGYLLGRLARLKRPPRDPLLALARRREQSTTEARPFQNLDYLPMEIRARWRSTSSQQVSPLCGGAETGKSTIC
ncbi:MAG: hypothetical protein HY290_17675 [Planctomycetia bacterium]|nr:hypothetical protein [Planctomycetia bacterium]